MQNYKKKYLKYKKKYINLKIYGGATMVDDDTDLLKLYNPDFITTDRSSENIQVLYSTELKDTDYLHMTRSSRESCKISGKYYNTSTTDKSIQLNQQNYGTIDSLFINFDRKLSSDTSKISYLTIPEDSHFFKSIQKKHATDFFKPNHEKIGWFGSYVTAASYIKDDNDYLYLFKSKKTLKLFNILDIHNINYIITAIDDLTDDETALIIKTFLEDEKLKEYFKLKPEILQILININTDDYHNIKKSLILIIKYSIGMKLPDDHTQNDCIFLIRENAVVSRIFRVMCNFKLNRLTNVKFINIITNRLSFNEKYTSNDLRRMSYYEIDYILTLILKYILKKNELDYAGYFGDETFTIYNTFHSEMCLFNWQNSLSIIPNPEPDFLKTCGLENDITNFDRFKSPEEQTPEGEIAEEQTPEGEIAEEQTGGDKEIEENPKEIEENPKEIEENPKKIIEENPKEKENILTEEKYKMKQSLFFPETLNNW